MESATSRMRPVLSKIHNLVTTFTANSNSSQISHFRQRHSITTLISNARTSKLSLEIKYTSSLGQKGISYAQNLWKRNNQCFLRTTNCFYSMHQSYGTRTENKVTEMTDEEKLLYRIIQSEKDSFPVDESSNREQSKGIGDDETGKAVPKKGKKKKTEKFKEKMSENLVSRKRENVRELGK